MNGPTRESFAQSADGTRLYVRERWPTADRKAESQPPGGSEGGRVPSRLTTILCDGICCDGYIWKYLWDDLSALTNLCHWNYRGHGRSAPPHDPNKIDTPAFAEDLDQVRRHVGDGPVVLVGHSMGCQVALEAFRQRPEKVLGLVLLCGSSGQLTHTFHGTNLLARVLPQLLRVTEHRPGLMRGLWSRIPVQVSLNIALAAGEVDKKTLDPADLVPYLEHATDMDFLLFLRMLRAAGDYSAADFLGTVDIPALVVAGDADKFTPPHLAEAMAKALPRAEFVLLHGATHVAPLEQRESVGARVSRFLQELGA